MQEYLYLLTEDGSVGAKLLRSSFTIFVVLILLVTGCTRGAVRDGTTGDFEPDAYVKFFEWPPPGASGSSELTWSWPISPDPVPADHTTQTQDGYAFGYYYDNWDGYNFAFDGVYSGSCNEEVEDETVTANNWYRFEIDKTGFEKGVFYRFHDGYKEECDIYNCSTNQWMYDVEACNSQQFDLWPSSDDHEVRPDMIVDPRGLAEEHYFQCVYLPGNLPGGLPSLVGVRASVATANVGTGPLYLEGLQPHGFCDTGFPCPEGFTCDMQAQECVSEVCDPQTHSPCPAQLICDSQTLECVPPNCDAQNPCAFGTCEAGRCTAPVIQRVSRSQSSATSDYTLASGFEFHEGHGHIHIEEYIALGFIDKSTSCDNWMNRPAWCSVGAGQKLSFCIMETALFDSEIENHFPTSGLNFDHGLTCQRTIQGMSPGLKDTYGHHLGGQVVVLGNAQDTYALADDDYWLEAVVDQDDNLVERENNGSEERSNNRARVNVTIPSFQYSPSGFTTTLCQASVWPSCPNCYPELDCSDCQGGYESDGRWHPCLNGASGSPIKQDQCKDYLEY